MTMSNPNLHFYGPVGHVNTGDIHGTTTNIQNNTLSADSQLEPAIAELHQLIQTLQQKYPNATPEEAPALIKAEITHIQQTQPQRWAILQQNLLKPDRWLQGGKNAAVKVGEYYAQNSPIGVAIVGFLEEFTKS